MRFVTSLTPPYHANMDKVDYEAKLASEVEKLRKFQESLEAEYTQTVQANNDGEPEIDPVALVKRIDTKLLQAADQATDTVLHLLEHADKDATKFAIAKYVIDRAGSRVAPGSSDPMEELLKKLTATTTVDADGDS